MIKLKRRRERERGASQNESEIQKKEKKVGCVLQTNLLAATKVLLITTPKQLPKSSIANLRLPHPFFHWVLCLLFFRFQVQPTCQAERSRHVHTHTHFFFTTTRITHFVLCCSIKLPEKMSANPYIKVFCERKEPEFHENESRMLSWKPGELINLLFIARARKRAG